MALSLLTRRLLHGIVLCFCTFPRISTPSALGPYFDSNPRERTRVRPDYNWNWGHHFSRVVVDSQRVPDVLSHVLDYNFTLPRVQLRRGLSYLGSACRLRRVVRDLLGHRDIKIGVIGGSVSWGEGASQRGVNDWFSGFSSYMIKAFPKSNVTARNGCTPGVQSSYMVMCMDLSVDVDVDLIFVEYTLNDGHDENLYDNRVVRNMERLLRRLLALPRLPAVVLVHHMIHFQAQYPQDHPKHGDMFKGFHETTEDVQGSLAQYYDAQSLSMRTALYRVSAHKEMPGFLWEEVMADFHAGDLGHKVITDLAVYMVQMTALDLMINPLGAVDDEVISEPLPRPMYKGNLPPNSPMCILYEHFKELVIENNGWEYVNEGTDVKPKPGYVATQPGSTFRVRLDTDRSSSADVSEAVHVFFHHLRSYERMGVAKFSCVSGCMCDEVVVDAHITERNSQLYLAEVVATQAAQCDIEITLLDQTSSGEHKFKVAGVVVSDQAGRPAGVYSMGGNNQAFGIRQHTGDQEQVVMTSNTVQGR